MGNINPTDEVMLSLDEETVIPSGGALDLSCGTSIKSSEKT